MTGASIWAEDGLGDSGWHDNTAAALRVWGIAADARLTLLSLSENATWRIDLPGGDRAVLRLHRPGYRRPDEIESEILWLEAIATEGVVAVAVPRRTPAGAATGRFPLPGGRGEQVGVLFDLAEGEGLGADDMVELAETCGRMAGLLQNHLARWPRPAGFVRPTLDVDTAIGPQAHWGCWRDHPSLTPTTEAVIAEVERKLRAEIAAYGAPPGRHGLIHGDMRAANMIRGPRGLTLIDFDDCAFTWHLYELACAMTFVETHPGLDRMVADWIGGFAVHAVLDPSDLAAIPAFLMLRRLLIVGWFATHHHTIEAPTLAADYAADTARIGRAYLEDRLIRL